MLNPTRLENLVADRMATFRVPGLALAIVLGTEVIYARGFGTTSVEYGGHPVAPETVFRIGSTTKPITATLVMRLVEQGKLELDRPILEYLPWVRFGQEGAAGGVTLRHLLSHTAGLVTAVEYVGWRDASGLEAHIREDLPRYPIVAPAGKLWSYSNLGFDLAGHIAEVAGGKPFAQLVQELVFDPLGMRRSTLDPVIALTYSAAQPHELDANGNPRVFHNYHDNVASYPSGMVMSTVLDLARFAIMHLGGGRYDGAQILSPESVAEMHRAQASLPVMPDGGYGLGWLMTPYKTLRTVAHPGSVSTFGSAFTMVPDRGIAVSLLFNREPNQFPSDSIVHAILEQMLDLPKSMPRPEPTPIANEPADRKRYVGEFVGNEAGLALFADRGNHLELSSNGEVIPLRPIGKGRYVGQTPSDGGQVPVGFVEEEHGPAQYVFVGPRALKRFSHVASALSMRDLRRLEGTFVNSGNTRRIVLQVGEQGLTATIVEGGAPRPTRPCIPIGGWTFAFAGGLLEFDVEIEGAAHSVRFQKKELLSRVTEAGS